MHRGAVTLDHVYREAKLVSTGCAVSAFAVLGLMTMPVGAAPMSVAAPQVIHFGPNVNLKEKDGTLKFKPATLTAPMAPGNCRAWDYQFSITNRTSAPKTITDNGAPFIKVPPGHKQIFCVWTVGTQIFGVEGAEATLTFNSTPR